MLATSAVIKPPDWWDVTGLTPDLLTEGRNFPLFKSDNIQIELAAGHRQVTYFSGDESVWNFMKSNITQRVTEQLIHFYKMMPHT